MWPDLPLEVVEHILDFMWDEKLTLFSVSLTCHRIRDSPVCHRLLDADIWVANRRHLDFVSRAVISKAMGKFYSQRTLRIIITEDPQRPFAHTVPLCIPATRVPKLYQVQLHDIDWTRYRPHASFYILLAHFRSVSWLILENCHFPSGSDLCQLTDALPNLQKLSLGRVSCGSLPTGKQHGSRTSIQVLYLWPIGDIDAYEPCDNTLLSTCASYTTVQILHTAMGCFDSLARLQCFVQNFASLTELEVTSASGLTWGSVVRPSTQQIVSPVDIPPFALSCLRLRLPPESIEQILNWLARSPSISTLRDLSILPSASSTAASLAIDHFLEKASNGLEKYSLKLFVPGYSFSLSADALATINLSVITLEDTKDLEMTLHAVIHALLSITSQNLDEIIITLAFRFDEFSARDIDSALTDSIRTNSLESVLSCAAFKLRDPLPSLRILCCGPRSPALGVALGIMSKYFAPWVVRGKLEVNSAGA
ncbi:hypothetical protein DAEQUDRAFT_727725 [Daedalea quercina L-15889]|uniref:F-box domain-containing protein n=1 Tax=Daedalea quercina L-15889 TaxID=1314783 RepID=A0A165PTA8_9APHY|nr:hypothetical protein DAEQUDRAFT_727725 [Daedalea quercina L-15889]